MNCVNLFVKFAIIISAKGGVVPFPYRSASAD